MKIAIATFEGMPGQFADDAELEAELAAAGATAERVRWDEPDADWDDYDLVVIRSTWDYSRRHDEFIAWAEQVGGRLHNAPALVRWNSDKHYLGELADAGFPVVPTTYVEPDEDPPELSGEVVVKPAVSAGALDTGRFSPAAHDAARELVVAITASGRAAMVQPYQAAVEERGETAIVLFDGELSHVLRKGTILGPDRIAPVSDDGLGIAAGVYYDSGLVVPGRATTAELGLADAIVAHVSERFGYLPLYARVDLLADDEGNPVLVELEAVEPNLYFDQSPGAAARLARAILARVEG